MRKRFRHSCRTTPSALLAALALLAATGCRDGAPSGLVDSVSVDAGARAGATYATGAAAPPMHIASERAHRVMASPAASTQAAPARDVVLGTASVSTGPDAAGTMLMRQGQASIEVRRVDEAVPRLRQLASQFGGFVANTAIRGGREETRAATLELRVPSAQFDALVGALNGLGKVETVTANAQDVGDEYVDLGARAVNARRLEARLTEMLATRTGKLSDVLTMEQELARVRQEIERYEGRLRFLERRSSLSTLAIAVHEPLPLIDRPNAGPLAEAFGAARERAVGMLAWCIASLGVIIPLGLLAGAVYVTVRWARRRVVMAGAGGDVAP